MTSDMLAFVGAKVVLFQPRAGDRQAETARSAASGRMDAHKTQLHFQRKICSPSPPPHTITKLAIFFFQISSLL